LNTQLQHIEQSSSPYQKQILSLQLITILWMCAEAAIALFAALRANSVALLGFGADSGIELVSAFVVFLRFKRVSHVNEKRAARITGVLLFALAAFILGSSILAVTNPRFRPEPSYLGMVLLMVAAIFMSWLSSQKRALAARANRWSSAFSHSRRCQSAQWVAQTEGAKFWLQCWHTWMTTIKRWSANGERHFRPTERQNRSSDSLEKTLKKDLGKRWGAVV
jgi:hypothetical protein